MDLLLRRAHRIRPRWLQTLLGFTAIGGVQWLSSVLADPTPVQPEDLDPDEVLDGHCDRVFVGGMPTHFHEYGDGPATLILLHGFGERLQIWRPIQEQLAPVAHSIAPDLWGFGATFRSPTLKPHDWVRQVMGLLDLRQIDRAIIVGHSLGARVGLMCASRHPDRVQAVVPVDADFGQAPHGYALIWALARTPLLPAVLGKIRTNPLHLQRLFDLVITPNHVVLPEDFQGFHRPLRVKGTVETWRSLATAPFISARALTRTIQCPALVIWGADDPLVPVWHGERLARDLQAELEIVPHSGHFPPEEYPSLVAERLREFIAGLPTP